MSQGDAVQQPKRSTVYCLLTSCGRSAAPVAGEPDPGEFAVGQDLDSDQEEEDIDEPAMPKRPPTRAPPLAVAVAVAKAQEVNDLCCVFVWS